MSQTEQIAATPPASAEHAHRTHDASRAFSTSIAISGIRCVLTYVVFPWLLPLVGVIGDVGPAIGLVVGTVAIWFNVASIRRFQSSGHPWRWAITAINVAVIGLLSALVVADVADLLA